MPDSADDATRVGATGVPQDATRVLASQASGAPAAPAVAAEGATVLAAGTRVAEFEVTRLIGQGGFGVVYEAWDHTLERVVALKEYLPGSLATRSASGSIVPLSERQRETFDLGMRSFINEARLLAQFDHPSLVKVYRFWEERGTTYLVMPYYQGRTLRQALAGTSGGADEAWLLGIVDGVSQALAVMHAAQCYHRDIAPDNIMLLDGSDRPVLLDFGAARRVISDKTQAITVILKPGYAPIEQYAEMPDMRQGAWTDVYALAAVLHVAVTGRVPPPSVGRILSDSYVPLAQDAALRQRYSAGLLAAIDAGLAVRPEARPQSVAAFRALLGLDQGDAGATVLVPRAASPASGAPGPAASGSRRGTLLGAGVLVALLLGGGAWWLLRAPPEVPAPEPPAETAATPASPAPASPPAPPVAVAEPSAPAVPVVPPPASERTPVESLQALALGATPGFDVTARPGKAQVVIGKDQLAFDVSSNRAGFVYVFLLDSQGEMYLLFPNALDKRNEIAPGQTLTLPRASWAMEAGGPAGVDRFAVLVSARERDFTQSGVLAGGVFPQFPTAVLAALEQARGDGPTPLLGHVICPEGQAGCADAWGVAHFEITEK
ncbi:MAG TPA: DUF4384 domain-containing protein [Ottowia sp.]|uniref:protein kinase domain-containing protein n=1 Tax=Ottowia sp. TaxID=1898956 RepID=UPI002B7ACD80|nr:protein kinase [Ottowia sp.]HMN20125.1 DUF4384 domain-containing protein [Ottowia sp.]